MKANYVIFSVMTLLIVLRIGYHYASGHPSEASQDSSQTASLMVNVTPSAGEERRKDCYCYTAYHKWDEKKIITTCDSLSWVITDRNFELFKVKVECE